MVLLAHLTIYVSIWLFGELNGMIHTSLLAPHVLIISLRSSNRFLPPKFTGWSMMNRYHSIRDIKARRIGGLPTCPRCSRTFYLVGALDRNSTTQMKRVITGLPPCIRQWIDEASGHIQ